VYYATVMRNNTLWTVLKRTYLMTVIDGVFSCVGRACDIQTLLIIILEILQW